MVNKMANDDGSYVSTKSLLITNLIPRISPSKIDHFY